MTFSDPANDVEGSAPDLTELKFSVDAACTFSFDPGASGMTLDDAVFTYIDRDGNAATGDTDLFGTDLFAVTAQRRDRSATLLAWWNGAQYVPDKSYHIETAPAPGGFSVAADRLGIPPGATPNFRVGVVRLIDDDVVGIDIAPDSEAPISLAVNYDGTPVVPTFADDDADGGPAALAVPAAPGRPADDGDPACTVPKVSGRSLAVAKRRLTASGCTRAATVTRRYSTTVPKGRVIGTTPGSGARTTKKVKLIVSKGKRPKRAKAAAVPRDLVTRARAFSLARQRSSIAGISACRNSKNATEFSSRRPAGESAPSASTPSFSARSQRVNSCSRRRIASYQRSCWMT